MIVRDVIDLLTQTTLLNGQLFKFLTKAWRLYVIMPCCCLITTPTRPPADTKSELDVIRKLNETLFCLHLIDTAQIESEWM